MRQNKKQPCGELVRKSELARKLGVSPSRISQLLQLGVLIEEQGGLIDYHKALAAIRDNIDPSRPQTKITDRC